MLTDSHVTVASLREQLAETARQLARTQDRLHDAMRRAELAEKSARDSWAFSRTLLRGSIGLGSR